MNLIRLLPLFIKHPINDESFEKLILSFLAALFSHTILPVPYFLADNAGPGLCLQWKEIFCAGHNSIFMAVLSTQEEYLQPVIIPGTCLANTKFPSLLPAQHWTDKGVLIMEKINWNKAWFMAVCWTKSILWYNILKCRYEKFQKQMVDGI